MPPPCPRCRGKRLSDKTRDEVDAILMDIEIWTRPDGPWYDPACPDFSKRVKRCVNKFRKEVC